MLHIDVGLSAIRASQQALYAISNNIANANTDGYHRQRVELIDRNPVTIGALQIGSGVDVDSLTRLRDTATEAALTSTASRFAESETALRILGQIESALLPTAGSLVSSVSRFFNEVEQLAAQPATVTIRDAVVAAAEDVARQISELDSRLNQLRTNNSIAISEEVDAVNQATSRIAQLNRDIRIAEHSGTQPNTLLDQRDRLVLELGGYVDISLQSYLVNESPLVGANGAIIIAEEATALAASTAADGRATIATAESQARVIPASGSLAARLAGQDLIDSVQQSLHDWATSFVAAIDRVHSTGRGQEQQQSFLSGVRQIQNANVPLQEVASPFAVDSGRIYVSITEATTKSRTTHAIDVDPATDSLNDVLANLGAIPNLSAGYQPDSKQVFIRAADGFTIDFSGGVDPLPQVSNLSGTSQPQLVGTPTITGNKNWTATLIGSGDVGVTPGLAVEFRESASGELVETVSIGAEYVPGEALSIKDGVDVIFSAGSVVAGEQFSFDVVNEPDETGLLVTLGINTLFNGTASTGIGVHEQVRASPLNFAASRSGAAGDAGNLKRLIQLRDRPIFVERNETLEENLASLSTRTAFRIEAEQASLDYLQQQKLHLENVRDSVSGVDPNEEVLNMLEFQRQFQAASRFITVIDEAVDELLRLIG